MDGVLKYCKHVFSNLVTEINTVMLYYFKSVVPIVGTLHFHLFKDAGVFFTVQESLSLI